MITICKISKIIKLENNEYSEEDLKTVSREIDKIVNNI